MLQLSDTKRVMLMQKMKHHDFHHVMRLLLMATVVLCAAGCSNSKRPVFQNQYVVQGDDGARASAWYIAKRAWVQITRDLSKTAVPPTVTLDVAKLQARPFAVSWLGHSAMLVRVGGMWGLIDPMLSGTAGPVPGFGPARLTPLPIAIDALPPIDFVLISHNHYDHLDLRSVRQLLRQQNTPPQFFVGRGLGPWFQAKLGAKAMEFDWWQHYKLGALDIHFVPAQHNSGRTLRDRNRTLWGGWVLQHAERTFYFSGDTAYVAELFQRIKTRFGRIDLAALPIGAYTPRPLMRFEHTNPEEAVLALQDLAATRAFGVHWGSFQLGNEEPFQPAIDLAAAVTKHAASNFGLLEIGGVLDIHRVSESEHSDGFIAPARMPSVMVKLK